MIEVSFGFVFGLSLVFVGGILVGFGSAMIYVGRQK